MVKVMWMWMRMVWMMIMLVVVAAVVVLVVVVVQTAGFISHSTHCVGGQGDARPPPRLVGNPYAGVLIQVTLCV